MVNRMFFWFPRLLTLAFALFLSVFAFAGLAGGHGLHAGLVHFATQIIPSLVILIALAVAWRWELPGGLLLLSLAIAYVATSWGRFPLSTYLVIAGPAFLAGLLFIASWIRVRRSTTRDIARADTGRPRPPGRESASKPSPKG